MNVSQKKTIRDAEALLKRIQHHEAKGETLTKFTASRSLAAVINWLKEDFKNG